MGNSLKRVIKCKCGEEFTTSEARAAHISKMMNMVSKGVRSSYGFRPFHGNAPGTVLRGNSVPWQRQFKKRNKPITPLRRNQAWALSLGLQ